MLKYIPFKIFSSHTLAFGFLGGSFRHNGMLFFPHGLIRKVHNLHLTFFLPHGWSGPLQMMTVETHTPSHVCFTNEHCSTTY